ncbi:MAG: phosphate ABC transporter permease subunit PstC [Holophagales bacterium]|nr:phosphate ABC transporter permease subunit PstC [Holophagales bacterium]
MFRWRAERAPGDRGITFVLRACAVVSGSVVLWISGFLVIESWPAISEVGAGRLAGDPSWHPAAGAEAGTFGLLPMVAGTVATAAGALVLAAPLALLSAIFCNFQAGALVASLYRRLIEVLAGIPSVVFGFWGLVVLVPLVRRWEPPGPSLLAGILVLAMMVLPTLALTADAAFRAVPSETLRAAAALGLSRTATVFGVLVPACRSGLGTGLLLGTGRALGETMAVVMVCGNVVQVPESVFEPVRTLTANIALEMAYAAGDHRSALFASGLLLTVLVAMLVMAGDGLVRRGRTEERA